MQNKIRAIIVDDEKKSSNVLSVLLASYCPSVEVVGIADSEQSAFQLINRSTIDLLFLDVEMPPKTGFDLLTRLGKINFEVIFVTGFDQYALQAIKFHALDYLLKPIDIDELILAVNKVKERLKKSVNTERIERLLDNIQTENKDKQQIAVVRQDGLEFIPIEEISRLQADGPCTWIYLIGDRKILSSKNLGEYQKVLPEYNSHFNHRFFRVHHSHVINLRYIQTFNRREKEVTLKDGSKIPVAQRRYPEFSEALRSQKLL